MKKGHFLDSLKLANEKNYFKKKKKDEPNDKPIYSPVSVDS